MAGLADLLVAQGVVTREELAEALSEGAAPAASPLAARRLPAEKVPAVLAKGGPVNRDGPAPKFAVGAAVRTRRPARNTLVADGHTRLPGYAAGVTGRVLRCHGCHVLPDANAHGLGERPEPLYTVAFAAGDLWGQAEAPGDTVTCDLWESYLEAAP